MQQQLKQLESENIASSIEILEFLTSTMRGDIKEDVSVSVRNGEKQIVKKNPAIKDRLKAAEMLSKRYAMFNNSDDNDNLTRKIIEAVGEID